MKIIIFLLTMCIFISPVFSDANAKYEPDDGKKLHGLGQYTAYLYSDEENWQYVYEYQNSVNQIPVIYSVYAAIDPVLSMLDSTDFIDIISNHEYPYVLLVGLMLFDSTAVVNNFNIPVEHILNGGYDPGIRKVAQRIKEINAPVFLRPGFEFGVDNYGFHNDPDVGPEDFKDIWMYIYNIFEEENVTNAAWIWNTVNPNLFSYIDWYPGDDYVNWWGINYFTADQIDNGDGFLQDAKSHNKPVMICESCPIQNGGTTNEANWDNWFVPYFNKIMSDSNIKAFVYISDPWDRGYFSSWPDSRINSDQTILNNYAVELSQPAYINMDDYINEVKEDMGNIVPQKMLITASNYPNPFNATTTFNVKQFIPGIVKIDIYNILGKKITTLSSNTVLDEVKILWNAENMPTGIYIAKIKPVSNNSYNYQSIKIKLLLIK